MTETDQAKERTTSLPLPPAEIERRLEQYPVEVLQTLQMVLQMRRSSAEA